LGNVKFGFGDGKGGLSGGVGPKCDLPGAVCGSPALYPRECDKIKDDRNGTGGSDVLENAFLAHFKILRLSGTSVKARAGTRLSVRNHTV
jgi:hypothetical protein